MGSSRHDRALSIRKREHQVADEAVNRIGAILEELGARFDLVVEAVSGFGGRLDTLRDEIFGQFAEVGGQIRFLSEQIAENRRGIVATRDDLGAEIVRMGEALGKARIEFRDELLAAADGPSRRIRRARRRVPRRSRARSGVHRQAGERPRGGETDRRFSSGKSRHRRRWRQRNSAPNSSKPANRWPISRASSTASTTGLRFRPATRINA